MYELKDGKGKVIEYHEHTDKKKFEGEYVNGLRNGMGKEYNKYGELIYKGEFLNGERNGKGREYDFDGNLAFEGEYLNGKEWKGKGYNRSKMIIYELNNENNLALEYNDLGRIIYEGEYLNGKRNGKGKEYNFNGQLIFSIEKEKDGMVKDMIS